MTEGMVKIGRRYSPAPGWHWKIRIYATDGQYAIAQVETERDMKCIELIIDFYAALTGCKLIVEGMGEERYANITPLDEAFKVLWKAKP